MCSRRLHNGEMHSVEPIRRSRLLFLVAGESHGEDGRGLLAPNGIAVGTSHGRLQAGARARAHEQGRLDLAGGGSVGRCLSPCRRHGGMDVKRPLLPCCSRTSFKGWPIGWGSALGD